MIPSGRAHNDMLLADQLSGEAGYAIDIGEAIGADGRGLV